jgi:prevent-host-death family protein
MRTELLTTLKRRATELISEVSTAREPLLITQHGMPAAYLVDVATYELMESRIGLLEGIAKGEKAIFEGRVVSNEDARTRMSCWPKMKNAF